MLTASCDCAWTGRVCHHTTPPVYDPTPRLTCDSCGGLFPVLVDDGPLCVRCDRLYHPEPLTWKAS